MEATSQCDSTRDSSRRLVLFRVKPSLLCHHVSDRVLRVVVMSYELLSCLTSYHHVLRVVIVYRICLDVLPFCVIQCPELRHISVPMYSLFGLSSTSVHHSVCHLPPRAYHWLIPTSYVYRHSYLLSSSLQHHPFRIAWRQRPEAHAVRESSLLQMVHLPLSGAYRT